MSLFPRAQFFRSCPFVGPKWGPKFCQQTSLSFHFQELPTEATTVALQLPKPAPTIPRHQGTNVPGTGARWPSSPRCHTARGCATRCHPRSWLWAVPRLKDSWLSPGAAHCSPPEPSTILVSHKGRQSQTFRLFLIFSIFSPWLIPFFLLP